MNVKTAVTRIVRNTLFAAPLLLAPALSGVVLQDTVLAKQISSGVAVAQDDKAKPQHNTRKTPALRENVYKKLAEVQVFTDAGDWNGALKELNELKGDTGKWNGYEMAQLWNYYGFVYYSLERYDDALRAYERVVANPDDIPVGLETATLYTMAQLAFIQEDYPKAIDMLTRWMNMSPIVGADAYVLRGQAYYSLNNFDKALPDINWAVNDYESKGKVPKENWFALQRAIYYEKGDNKKVVQILEKLVKHYPKASYWRQLGGMYGAVNREKDQLHALEAAYLMGAVTNEKELLNIAYLFLGEEAPYKAAKIIDKGIKDKRIEPTSKNLETLAAAWRMAQEVKKSLPEMEKAAAKSDNGDLYARLAGIYLDNDMFDKCIDAGEVALKRKGIKREDQLQIVLGMAHVNKKQYDSAIRAFKKAAEDKRSAKFARQWIQYAESEREREKQLALD
ncbi:tetratricopeptide repeat protein [Simiduia sp. 21SJ11W-1]|uniref:tetratricopeptide repeat protein n=1 Tax=Simiduia sp. 21SJ11W-1 TaxID=2909669 RepID=UPI00209CE87B|nr:tetratricopeptide repeat protein [Simiduia sp. 21SJ11W-1]UTA48123.1 tetratricopeptide repeat protein [Simiduia sp. 21SJ11W-1]